MKKELESITHISPAHIDARGSIINMFEGEIQHIAHITSKAGSVRANHYHQTLHQYMYCISGEFESWSCDVNDPESKQMVIVKPGDIVSTPPGIAHAQRFTKDSVVIALSTTARSAGKYEDDTIAFKVVEGYINPELVR